MADCNATYKDFVTCGLRAHHAGPHEGGVEVWSDDAPECSPHFRGDEPLTQILTTLERIAVALERLADKV